MACAVRAFTMKRSGVADDYITFGDRIGRSVYDILAASLVNKQKFKKIVVTVRQSSVFAVMFFVNEMTRTADRICF